MSLGSWPNIKASTNAWSSVLNCDMSASKMQRPKMNLVLRETGKRPVSAKQNTVPASTSVSDPDSQREAGSQDDISSVLVVRQQRLCFAVGLCRTPWSKEMMQEK